MSVEALKEDVMSNKRFVREKENEVLEKTSEVNEAILKAKDEVKIGVVAECETLNVRKEPSIQSEVMSLIKNLSRVEVDEKNSVGDFYKVRTESGIEGYCMKKYIRV